MNNFTNYCFYNTGFDKKPILITYSDLLLKYSQGLIDQFLTISLMFLAFDFFVLYYTNEDSFWELPVIWKLDWNNKKQVKDKLLRSFALICLVPAMTLPAILVGIKFGVL